MCPVEHVLLVIIRQPLTAKQSKILLMTKTNDKEIKHDYDGDSFTPNYYFMQFITS